MFISLPIFVVILPNDLTDRCDDSGDWGAVGCTGESETARHKHTHSGLVFQTKPVTCVMNTAGWAMVHVLPRLLLLVIHKLRPTPVV